MRRLSAIAVCCLAFALVWASAAGASAAPRNTDFLRVQDRAASPPAGSFAQAGAQTRPLSGTLQEFDGSPLANGWISWGWWDPDGYSWYCPDAVYHNGGDASTGDDGAFSFPSVASHPAHDTLVAGGDSRSGPIYTTLYHLDFSATGSYDLRPGHVNISVAHAPSGRQASVGLGDALFAIAQSSVDLTDGIGVADAMPPDINSARVSFPSANGAVRAECEWVSPGHAPVSVSPGAVAGTTVAVDWNAAVRGRLAGPRCRHSGRPGSTVRYSISNLPAGEQISFVGYSWSPADWGVQTYPQVVTSSGPQDTYTVALQIPARATVGQVYDVDAERSDDIQSMLWLYDYYEVCDIAATHSSITRGDSLRLRGHIDAKRATLFMSHRRAGQPASAKALGWAKVGNLSVSAHGRFVSRRLHPSHTTWYVVRYRGMGGGFLAFTPVVKVSVH
jgi:hypothetical protein